MKAIDRIGQRFGSLVIEDIITEKGKNAKAVCRCDCGRVKSITVCSLVTGRTVNCGCKRKKAEEYVGDRNGRTLVVGVVRVNNEKRLKCVCDCGTEWIVTLSNFSRTKSCGCWQKENPNHMTHGFTRNGQMPPEYRVWSQMKARCLQPNRPDYDYYGGRGIKVCDRWVNSYENFLADMGSKPDGGTLERLDVNGNYEPENCIWASRKAQARNTRSNKMITFRGETLCLVEWMEKLNLPYHTIKTRLNRGWSVEKAFTEPVRTR